MEPVDKAVCEAKCKVMDERFARDLKDIDNCKNRLQKIEELTIQMAELVKASQEANQKALDDHNDRLTALEHRPSMWWEAAVGRDLRRCGGVNQSDRIRDCEVKTMRIWVSVAALVNAIALGLLALSTYIPGLWV